MASHCDDIIFGSHPKCLTGHSHTREDGQTCRADDAAGGDLRSFTCLSLETFAEGVRADGERSAAHAGPGGLDSLGLWAQCGEVRLKYSEPSERGAAWRDVRLMLLDLPAAAVLAGLKHFDLP